MKLNLPNPLRPARPAQTTVDGVPAPAVLKVAASHVRVGDGYAATFAVYGYPAEVGPAWLDALLSYPARIDVAIHVTPLAPQIAASMLKRQRAKLESTRRLDADHGKLGDPTVEAAATDAADLADRVARGAAKLFDTGIYITIHARDLTELGTVCAGVRSAAASVLLDLVPATFRQQQGWVATLPVGVDPLKMRRVLDTTALAAAFPLASADPAAPAPGQLPESTGVLYGVNTTSAGVLLWNRWAQDNHNSVVLARSGAGKSYFVKLEVLRSLYQGVQVAVVDPEDEYTPLAEHVGGAVVRLGEPGVHVNPFDLPAERSKTNTLQRRAVQVHSLVCVMLGASGRDGPVSEQERDALDRAITAAYAGAGITNDPATWDRPAPLLRDLHPPLDADPDPAATALSRRLARWTRGNFAGMFDAATSTQPEGHLVVWSLRHLPDELRGVGMMLALDSVWNTIDAPQLTGRVRQRRLVVVDEAWLLMRDGLGAAFLFRMAKAARKRAAGLTVITQDAADVLGSELGLAVVSNAATQVLMRQSAQSIDAVAAAFNLTAGEARLLLSAPRGEGLLVAGRSRIPFRSRASGAEHTLAVTGIGEDV
jgi:type IV secretory pathway VirB4 component